MSPGLELEAGGWKLETGGAATMERQPIRSHEDLEVYRRALALVRPAHQIVKAFPSYEDADLVQQMRRASKSIPTNVAEGFAKRRSAKDFKLYLAYALGSANEMLMHLTLAAELGYATKEDISALADDYRIICRQINKLIQRWK